MQIATLVERFLRHCKREQKAPATLAQYGSQLGKFVAKFGRRKWAALDRDDVLDWLSDSCRDRSSSTESALKASLKLLQDYAMEEHELPLLFRKRDLRKPATAVRERIASADETRLILGAATSPEWSAAYEFLRLTGCRPSELVAATIADLDGGNGSRTLVLAKHKTSRRVGRSRRIPIGPHVARLVDRAIAGRDAGVLFLDENGNQWTVRKLSRIFRAIRRELKLTEQLVLYSARHEFGTSVAAAEGILVAKELLGHSDISTTQRYAHPSDEQLRDAQSRVAPIKPKRKRKRK